MSAIGITGTREGCTQAQLRQLSATLEDLRDHWGATELHHGDCIGVDLEAARIAQGLGYRTVAHPPASDRLRGWHPSDEELEPMHYLDRNRAIVDASDVLIGCPASEAEQSRGGTWYTIRYARKVERVKLLVIGPAGGLPIESRGFTCEAR